MTRVINITMTVCDEVNDNKVVLNYSDNQGREEAIRFESEEDASIYVKYLAERARTEMKAEGEYIDKVLNQ